MNFSNYFVLFRLSFLRLLAFCIPIFILVSCGFFDPVEEAETEIIEVVKDSILIADKFNSKVLLMGKEILMVDQYFETITDLSHLNNQFVEISGCTDSIFNTVPEYCDGYKMVAVNYNGKSGFIRGDQAFEMVKSNNYKKRILNTDSIEFIATGNFGIGVFNDEGLTFCDFHEPTLIQDSKNNYLGVVRMVKNELYQGDYAYFQLSANDMVAEEVDRVFYQNDTLAANIRAHYQEGGAEFLILFYLDDQSRYWAEIVSKKLLPF